MPYLIGSIIGALIATYLVSALFMWLTKRMGDTASRIVTAFGLGFVAMFVLSGFGSADGGPFNPWKNLPFYGPAFRGRLRERAKSYAKALANDILR